MSVSHFINMSLLLCSFPLFAANPASEREFEIQVDSKAFNDYWYQGKAEISRYELKQARYGEIHPGEAVLIFVTEDFLANQQVKHEFGDGPHYPVLKLNATWNFNTGLYPYSLMTSTFTKVDFANPETAKVTFSGQEWCGQVFMQINRRPKDIQIRSFSYFQNEGDAQNKLPLTPMEDGIWTRIRMAPDQLPLGQFKMLPSLLLTRLLHKRFEPKMVTATLDKVQNKTFSKTEIYRYGLDYSQVGRVLAIFFEKVAPYKIVGWQDTYQSGFGPQAKTLKTTAVKTHEMFTDYWSKNRTSHTQLRKQLGLQ